MTIARLTDHAAEQLFRSFIVAISGLDEDLVRIGYLDAVRPVDPWIAMVPVANAGEGRTFRDAPTAQVSAGTAYQARIAQWEIRAYGLAAVDALHTIAQELAGDGAILRSVITQGVGIRSVSDVRTTTAPKGPTWEPRGLLSVTLCYLRQITTTAVGDGASVIVNATGYGAGQTPITEAPATTVPEPEPGP